MKLPFINKRVGQILKLKGLKYQDVIDRGSEMGKKLHGISRWVKGVVSPSFETAITLADCLDIPIGFFYFNNVEVEMKNNFVKIVILETGEVVKFEF